MPNVTATFDVTGWEPAPYPTDHAGPTLSMATVRKAFRGPLEGESTAQLLMCQADPKDLSAGAGYIVSEIVSGRLEGRSGTFVMHHWGVGDAGGNRTAGHIVPGSGTGELEGLTGSVEIAVDADGGHTITLEYDLP